MKKTYRALALLIVLFTILALYGQYRVVRYPRITVDPTPLPHSLVLDSGLEVAASGGYLKEILETRFRAYQPDVSLHISTNEQTARQIIRFENIHPDAVFTWTGDGRAKVLEIKHGLLREVELSGMQAGEGLNLSWEFPKKSVYRFVAIGDTGGDQELSWGLIRAHELGADFVLHLGDAYYDKLEIGGIGARMNESEIPVYTANGNHDFLGPNGNAIDQFLKNIGPLNARFSLLGNCFINLDTGSYMYPPHKGARADLLAAEGVNHRRNPERCANTIVFTHKPMVVEFEAEFPQRKHALHGYDSKSMINQLRQLDRVTVIAGHIHNDFEFEQDGFKTYVTGTGLAHKDLVQGEHFARVLVGEIRADKPLKLEWELNAMPMEYHCSKKIYELLKRHKSPLAKEVRDACAARL
jgi:hypothetical protein